ncbi:hypothetical protein C3E79_10380 [Corynebacterium liangguodongii]|uniref:Uncharacterized protein n=2 Tax=Corynebacterium liangguodongii TaxID=2079535 RepID=A0A2S0WHB8_9CORY|nr:hypothetical protein C3E79_10380 [Corynebacterium liangguodongii]PWB99251.1 hypothetical protein DF219_07995 [Corynebacterium liangguodongii]
MVPGEAFALRDMVVVPEMALTHAALGFGDLPARNVPQDAVLALVPWPVLAARAIVIGSACAAAYAGFRAGTSTFGRAAAMTVAVWNPFVVERLLQGQWSLAAAAWLVPFIALAARGIGPIVGSWVASLTPTGALAALALARTRGQALACALCCAPWVIAGFLATGTGTASPASSTAFAPRAERWVGTLGAMAGLGGIWNAEASPASRGAGFAVFGVVLAIVLAGGWRAVSPRLRVLAVVGFALAVASWLGLVGLVIGWLPGAGLLRDGQKWLILAIPAFVSAAGALRPRVAAVACACALLQVPDAPAAVSQLRPARVELPAIDDRGRDVLFVDRPGLLSRADGVPVVDPATKAFNVVESGELRIDARVVDAPSPRWQAAQARPGDLDYLADLGIGVVVYPDGRVVVTGAPARGPEPVGLALLALWCVAPLASRLKLTKD